MTNFHLGSLNNYNTFNNHNINGGYDDDDNNNNNDNDR